MPDQNQLLSRDTSSLAEAAQITLLREVGMGKRLQLTRSLTASMLNLSRASLQVRYPKLSPAQIAIRLARQAYGEELVDRLTGVS